MSYRLEAAPGYGYLVRKKITLHAAKRARPVSGDKETSIVDILPSNSDGSTSRNEDSAARRNRSRKMDFLTFDLFNRLVIIRSWFIYILSIREKFHIAWSVIFFLTVVAGTFVRNIFCYATSKCANTIIKNIRNFDFVPRKYRGGRKITITRSSFQSIRHIKTLIPAYGILKGNYPFGSLVTIVLYSQRFYSPITNIIRYLQMLQKFPLASLEHANDR